MDMSKYMNPPEPLCYSCRYAIKRGPFRLCDKGRDGYKHIGEAVECEEYRQIED